MHSSTIIKRILINILDEFILLCENNNLKYTLLGGSVLGAIRHQGIIPWDDDIDIGMPRPDYNKFLSIANYSLNKKYKMVSMYNEDRFCYPFTKLYDTETTLIEFKDYPFIYGIHIDIFPLDGIPKELNIRKAIIPSIQKRRNAAGFLAKAESSLNYKIKHLLAYFWYHFLYKNSHSSLMECENLAQKYPINKEHDIINHYGAWGEKEISDYSWFFPLKEYTFEGRKVWGPNNFDAYLTKMYGNYMTPPPIEKRRSHHSHYFISLSRRYTLEDIHNMGY